MATTPNPYFKVVKTTANGTKIAGKRRPLNQVFQAPETQVRFLVLEGVLVQTDATGLPISTATPASGGQADFSDPANSGAAPAAT